MFRTVKLLCNVVMVEKCHYTFVQTWRMYKTKSEPPVRPPPLSACTNQAPATKSDPA